LELILVSRILWAEREEMT
jgi:hypothetical protein